ncbi:Uncharacterised protein [Mycobacteroides abscessus subsp. abscessus]|uniref:hypothetical protein n=1 Tax=Mycobacteroides abscessus TaxID=36809 RepID=UPI00092B1B73|nr:hypothetical protein [Mycobacteroides abscessus]SIH23324.1 Uncharacterised protein [Mycobacteroides abscessus subsp. abscessus]
MSARVRAVPVGTIAWNDDRSNIALRHWDQSWRYVFDPPEGQANIADGWEYWEPGYCPARMVPLTAFVGVVDDLNELRAQQGS